MKYQLGDKVLILHSEEEGEIIDFINDKMVMVEVRGVKFPVYLDQIDFPYFKRFSQQKNKPGSKPKPQRQFVDDVKKEKPSAAPRVEDGVWLTFLPVIHTDEFGDDVVEELKLHLVNRTKVPYNYHYKLLFFGEKDFELKGAIAPFEDIYLHDVQFSDLNDSPVFDFEFTLQQPDKTRAPHYESSVKLKPKQLFEKIAKLRESNEATFSQQLFVKYPYANADEPEKPEDKLGLDRLAALGYKVYNAKEARNHLEPARSVVDLHIEKLANDWLHMSNFEILTLQLRTFEKYYDLALAHRQPSLVIIHGVGEGKLRDEIHEILRMKKEVKSFVNQYDPRFGYGATEIWFQYKK